MERFVVIPDGKTVQDLPILTPPVPSPVSITNFLPFLFNLVALAPVPK